MFVQVFLLLMNIRNINADHSTRVIDVNVTKLENGSHVCTPLYPYKMTYYEPFEVRINTGHLENVMLLGTSKCVLNDETTYIESFKKKKSYYVSTNKLMVAENNVNEFRCDLQLEKPLAGAGIETVPCAIRLYPIRDPAYCTGHMTVDGQDENGVKFTTSEKYEYSDIQGTFNFYDGQYVNFVCFIKEKQDNSANVIEMTYTDKDNKSRITTDYLVVRNRNMFVKLTKNYNNGYFDCKFANFEKTRFTVVRLLLKVIKMPPEQYFLVNGVTLSTKDTENKRTLTYEYYENEHVHISYKSRQEIKSISCHGEHYHPNGNSTNENEFVADIEPQNKIRMDLHCDIEYKKRGSNTSVSLQLTPQEFTNAPTIPGLSMLNILAKYAVSTVSQNKTIVYYQYTTEGLNLTSSCHNDRYVYITNGPISISLRYVQYLQRYGDKHLKLGESIVPEDLDDKTRKFKLSNDATSGKIMCEEQGVFTEIFLLGEGYTGRTINTTATRPGDNQPYDNTTPTFVDGRSVSTPSASTDTSAEETFFTKHLYHIIGGVLLFSFVVLTCSIVTCIKRNNRKDLDDTKVIYNNMEGSGSDNGKPSGQTSLPAHEELYATPINSIENNHYAQPYVPKNVEEMYSQAIPKSQRQISHEEPGYASVGESNYAEVLPKSVRQGIAVLPMGGTKPLKKTDRYPNFNKEIPYATICATKPNKTVDRKPNTIDELYNLPCTSNSSNSVSIANENPYAEVGCNTPTNKYANVFDNQRYVNANKTDDYAEPAYCELSGYNK